MKRDRIPKDEELEVSLKNDFLGRNIYLRNLMQMLSTILEYTILAIDGKWGSGKTFFIKQFDFLSKNPNNYTNINKEIVDKFNQHFSFFYFNAWENDHLPPVEAVLLRLKDSLWSDEEELSNKAIGIVKGIMNIPIRYFSGGTMDLDNFTDTYIGSYIERAEHISRASEEISNILYNYEQKTGKKILFVIDDLDRCKPTFAVELFESIKHNFNSDSAAFVICANNEQLQYTIKKYYGEGFDGYEYLDRFYDLVINLPEPDIERYVKYNLRLDEPDNIYNQVAIDIAKIEHMSLRQVNRYISNIMLMEDFIKSQNIDFGLRGKSYIKNIFVQVAMALKILDKKRFDDFISGDGEYILDEYLKKSETIKGIASSMGSKGFPIKNYYLGIFNSRSVNYSDREEFVRAVTSIGFSTIIDGVRQGQ